MEQMQSRRRRNKKSLSNSDTKIPLSIRLLNDHTQEEEEELEMYENEYLGDLDLDKIESNFNLAPKKKEVKEKKFLPINELEFPSFEEEKKEQNFKDSESESSSEDEIKRVSQTRNLLTPVTPVR